MCFIFILEEVVSCLSMYEDKCALESKEMNGHGSMTGGWNLKV